MIYIVILLIYFSSTGTAFGQILNLDSKCEVTLSEGIIVTCYQSNNSNQYYYLPVNLRLSTNKNGQSEFSFLLYKDENGNPKGAIMHWLLTWGLTKKQLSESNKLIKQTLGEETELVGAVLPNLINNNKSFIISGNSKGANILKHSIKSVGTNPILPNSKSAASFQLDANNAVTLQQIFKNKEGLKDTEIVMVFNIQFKSKRTYSVQNMSFTLKQNVNQLLKHEL